VAVGQHGRWWWGVGDARSRPRESAFSWDARWDQYVSCIRNWSEPVLDRQRRRNGAILEGQRNTEVYLSATRSFQRLVFLP